MDKTEQMKNRLYNKMKAEYDIFIDQLEGKPPAEIIKSSYEKVFKEDLLLSVEDKEFTYEEAKALFSLKCPLDALYQEWLDTDVSYMDMLRDIVDTKTQSAVKEMRAVEMER